MMERKEKPMSFKNFGLFFKKTATESNSSTINRSRSQQNQRTKSAETFTDLPGLRLTKTRAETSSNATSPISSYPINRSSSSLDFGTNRKLSSKYARYMSQTDEDWGLPNSNTSFTKNTRFNGASATSSTNNSSSRHHRHGVQCATDSNSARKYIDMFEKNALKPSPKSANQTAEAEVALINCQMSRIKKFTRVLEAPVVDLIALRTLSWNGVPPELRPIVWKMLLGYAPSNASRRDSTLEKKREDYFAIRDTLFHTEGEYGHLDQALWHQVAIDVPRTNASIPLYQNPATQRILERILYIWATRHPASGYVQGINDLVTPFYQVFLLPYTQPYDPETFDVRQLTKRQLDEVEADCFWCLSKLLDGIQDNYIHAQPGIQRQVMKLQELTYRIDAPLAKHLQSEGVDFLQFSFRWMNCLLMRELSIENIIRMWDTYMAEGPDGFSDFHLYVCASFLVKWSSELQKMEFQEILIFLQSLPVASWTDSDIELLLSEAFLWKSLFSGATAHLRQS
ncbi:GTPase activating protein Gyp1 [Schizosaccharomyces japonicus yFS275]|uniref:GTPase activating protein Gyp1 n=1 Tax=Schizosaccharomyces japonicus (strain yFS275 / FY16936) TaxID=402676 RepID=B6K744_SCHJY|nr:GTPase activating protein Gyp1 [Schizosaccharomyces japonicus yFS275]EEB09348.1 GTPase activating protein Gyp1 [Schizosaccharomyces japonicus yFS275]